MDLRLSCLGRTQSSTVVPTYFQVGLNESVDEAGRHARVEDMGSSSCRFWGGFCHNHVKIEEMLAPLYK